MRTWVGACRQGRPVCLALVIELTWWGQVPGGQVEKWAGGEVGRKRGAEERMRGGGVERCDR